MNYGKKRGHCRKKINIRRLFRKQYLLSRSIRGLDEINAVFHLRERFRASVYHAAAYIENCRAGKLFYAGQPFADIPGLGDFGRGIEKICGYHPARGADRSRRGRGNRGLFIQNRLIAR